MKVVFSLVCGQICEGLFVLNCILRILSAYTFSDVKDLFHINRDDEILLNPINLFSLLVHILLIMCRQSHHPVILVKMKVFFKTMHLHHSFVINFDLHYPLLYFPLQRSKISVNCYVANFAHFVSSTMDPGFEPHQYLLTGTSI